MSYIGRQNLGGAYRQLDDISSGFDGSDTTHTMQVNSQNVTVGDVNQIILSLGGVIQKPGTDFTVSGSTLTFTTAPASSTTFFAILLGSDNGGTVTPTDSSVTSAKLSGNLVTPGTLDVNGQELILDADADTSVTADTDDRIDFRAGGSDIVHIFGNGNVSIGTTDDNAKLQIRKADSSVSPSSDADELFIENNGNTGITIGSSTTGTGNIHFGDSGDTDRALISYSHNTDHMTITHEGDESIVMGGGRFQTGGETAGNVDAGGICANHGANDGMVLNFKNSDIAHGITGVKQTDTYGFFEKKSATAGGLKIGGLVESASIAGIELFTTVTSEDTDEASGAEGAIQTNSMLKSGTGNQGMQADGNAFVVRVNTTQFIVKADGELFSNQSATVGTFDEYDDAQLIRAYDLSHGKGVINSSFDKFVKYNKDDLKDARLIGKDKDNNPTSFVNVTGFVRLHNGAIWQQYEKHQRLAEAVYEMAKEALGEDKADAILEKHDIQLLN
jgi:hypothetical protein